MPAHQLARAQQKREDQGGQRGEQIPGVPPDVIGPPEAVEEEEGSKPGEQQGPRSPRDSRLRHRAEPSQGHERRELGGDPVGIVSESRREVGRRQLGAEAVPNIPCETRLQTPSDSTPRRCRRTGARRRQTPAACLGRQRMATRIGSRQQGVRRPHEDRDAESDAGRGSPGVCAMGAQREENRGRRPHRGDDVAHRLHGLVEHDRAHAEDRSSGRRERTGQPDFAAQEVHEEDARHGGERAHEEWSEAPSPEQRRGGHVQREARRIHGHHGAGPGARLVRERNEGAIESVGKPEPLDGADRLNDPARQDVAGRVGVAGRIAASEAEPEVRDQQNAVPDQRHRRERPRGSIERRSNDSQRSSISRARRSLEKEKPRNESWAPK